MDELHRRALIRGVTTFLAVAVAGSFLVSRASGENEVAATPIDSSTPSVSTAPPEPLGWLTWVPGGLPEGYGDLLATVPDVAATTTAAADVAWLTASFDDEGDGVDQPEAPMMIPLDVTAVDPTFTAFVPEPERQLVQNLRADEAILSESEAKLRGLGRGATLLFDGGQRLRVTGTLPDALMGGYEVLVTRDTGRRIGVTQDRYALFHLRPNADVTADQLVTSFRELLPADTPYPAVEVRAPGETPFLRANDRQLPPLVLKEAFGEFLAHPDPQHPGAIVIDPTWVQDRISSATLPTLGTITCHDDVIAALRRTLGTRSAVVAAITDVGACFDPATDPSGPDGPLPPAAWGASIELNQAANTPGDAPQQVQALLRAMRKAGFTWAGDDAYPQGALFRLTRSSGPKD